MAISPKVTITTIIATTTGAGVVTAASAGFSFVLTGRTTFA